MPYWDIDTGFAALLMLLTAVDEGLGACFFGIPPRADRRVPGGVRGAARSITPIGAITVGYRAPDHGRRRCAGGAGRWTRWSTADGGRQLPADRHVAGLARLSQAGQCATSREEGVPS